MQSQCNHSNRSEFPAEINIHFPGMEGLDKPTVWVFPHLVVCLDCGLTQFPINSAELQRLTQPDRSAKSNIAAA
jgi:hypothetical protein